jgi:acetylornithine deacetylase/succinyl-diaminopimelate desuccinylase-like protein
MAEKSLEYLRANQGRFVDELIEVLRIPSISALPEHKQDVRRCAEWLAEHMRGVGLKRAELYETGGHPIVYGEWLGAAGKPTVLVYNHYDVQPVDPLEEWETAPFEPTVRDGRLFGRGSTDDKGQLMLHLKAVEALLRTEGGLPINLKFIFEGEEESGSVHLDEFLASQRELLTADLALISDTPMFAPGMPSICYGLRGNTYWQIDIEGPNSDLHSGAFGGAVANPAEMLARIIASLKDERGHVTVPGFYDEVRPLSERERAEIARLPLDEVAYKRELGVEALWGEESYSVLEQVWTRPTLEVCGLWGGFQGQGAKTIIPARAAAKLSCRLVPDQDPERITQLVEVHLQRICPPGVRLRFTDLHGGKPSVTPLDHPAVGAAARALRRAFGAEAAYIRAGGSIPVVASFEELLGLSTVLLGFGLPDERYHAPNEHFDLGNYEAGMRTAVLLWEELAKTDLRL